MDWGEVGVCISGVLWLGALVGCSGCELSGGIGVVPMGAADPGGVA